MGKVSGPGPGHFNTGKCRVAGGRGRWTRVMVQETGAIADRGVCLAAFVAPHMKGCMVDIGIRQLATTNALIVSFAQS